MITIIRTSSREIGALLGFALDWHQQDRHNADIEICDDPICALANAIDGVDPEAGTFLPGNHAIVITVETIEEEPARDNGGDGIEVQADLDELVAQGRIITDGYAYWSKRCPVCHKMTMQVVRPGMVQCTEGCGR